MAISGTTITSPQDAPGAAPSSAKPRALTVAIALTLAATHVVALAVIIVSAPWAQWNELRLSVVAGLLDGYSLYATLDAGPILPWIYLPVSAFVFLPAALLRAPAHAVLAGCAIAAICTTAPAAWLHFQRGRRERLGAALCWIGFSAYGIFTITTPATHYSCYAVHVDAPALAAAAFACITLLRWLSASPRLSGLILPASFAAVAASCKQTMLPLIAVLVVWLVVERGWRIAVAFGAMAGSILTAVLLAASAWLGYEGMWLNAVEIPSHHPLEWGEVTFATAVLLPAIVCLAVVIAGWAIRRSDATAARDPRSGVGLLIAVGFAMVPSAVLARAKHGGDVNNYSLILYFLMLAASIELPDVLASQFSRGAQASPLVRAAVLLGIFALAANGLWSATERARQTFLVDATPPITYAFEFERDHGNGAFFPHHPLVMLRTDGRLYHETHAVADWKLAGKPLSRARLRADLPRDLRPIAVDALEDPPEFLGELRRIVAPADRAYEWRFFAPVP